MNRLEFLQDWCWFGRPSGPMPHPTVCGAIRAHIEVKPPATGGPGFVRIGRTLDRRYKKAMKEARA